MDFGKAFSFVFDDEEWLTKIGIAGLIVLIPLVGGIVIFGWGLEVAKRVIQKDPEPLPDWSDFGGYLVNGFLGILISFVFFLPVILVQGCSTGLTPLLENMNQDSALTVIWIVTACFGCFTFLYSLAAYLVLPAALGRFAATGEIGAAFKFGEVFGMVRENLGTYALVLLGMLVSSLVASIGVIACVIGVLFTSAYSAVILGHLIGQSYNVATAGEIAPPSEPIPAAN